MRVLTCYSRLIIVTFIHVYCHSDKASHHTSVRHVFQTTMRKQYHILVLCTCPFISVSQSTVSGNNRKC